MHANFKSSMKLTNENPQNIPLIHIFVNSYYTGRPLHRTIVNASRNPFQWRLLSRLNSISLALTRHVCRQQCSLHHHTETLLFDMVTFSWCPLCITVPITSILFKFLRLCPFSNLFLLLTMLHKNSFTVNIFLQRNVTLVFSKG